MHVVVESRTSVTEARRMLANVVVREALGGMWKHIESVRIRLADSRACDCVLEVQLASGARLECKGAAENTADAFERAAHAMRRRMLAELGLPLPTRARSGRSAPAAERRDA